MAERLVVDTGPLIALARADALGVIGALPIEFVAPETVRGELDEGVRRGHAPVSAPWLRFIEAATPMIDAVARVELGAESVGVLVETSGRRRDRTFAYKAYLERLSSETDLEEG